MQFTENKKARYVIIKKIIVAIVLLILGIIGVTMLYKYNPAKVSFFPPSPFYTLTGYYCPGCGSTRATHALLHGDILTAANYNIFYVVFMPYILYELTAIGMKYFFNVKMRRIFIPHKVINGIFAAIILFWILRNIPVAPFTILAP